MNSDCAESDDDPLALAFLSLHVLAASQISLNQIVRLSIGNESTLLSSILCSLFPELSWNIEILKRCFKGVFVAFRFGYLVSAFLPAVLRRKLFWQIFVIWPVQNKKKYM